MTLELLNALSKLSPTILYLAGTIYLFHLLIKAKDKHAKDLELLNEKYYNLLSVHTAALEDIKEALKEK